MINYVQVTDCCGAPDLEMDSTGDANGNRENVTRCLNCGDLTRSSVTVTRVNGMEGLAYTCTSTGDPDE